MREFVRLEVAGARPGDVVVPLGAGDATLLGPEVLAALRRQQPAPDGEPRP